MQQQRSADHAHPTSPPPGGRPAAVTVMPLYGLPGLPSDEPLAARGPIDDAGERARRVAIQLAIAERADELLYGEDPALRGDEREALSRLVEDLGDVATDVNRNGCADLEAALLRLGADVQIWLESIGREAAR